MNYALLLLTLPGVLYLLFHGLFADGRRDYRIQGL